MAWLIIRSLGTFILVIVLGMIAVLLYSASGMLGGMFGTSGTALGVNLILAYSPYVVVLAAIITAVIFYRGYRRLHSAH